MNEQACAPGVRFQRIRDITRALARPLSAEDCCVQSMPDCSPVKWHLAHTTWFFETFVLEHFEPAFKPFDSTFRMLFNSYYNGIGPKHPRPRRGLLTRPDLSTVLRYRDAVDERMSRLLARGGDASLARLVELGLQHEQQHQELILTDIKHLLSCHPSWPAYQAPRPVSRARTSLKTPRWIAHAGGMVRIGHEGGGFSFDNERPRHGVYLQPFELASRLVTNGEYLAFIQDGGYRDCALWLAEGWDWAAANGIGSPTYWRQAGPRGEWREFTLHGETALALDQPVVHLSYFEADAYARWARARLPTEAEWEVCASAGPAAPNPDAACFADAGVFHPMAEIGDALQLQGSVWQWTSSSYAAYPGFVPAEGAVGEYNGKFMVNQYVLRGGSCATPADHVRATYRNFFPAGARWQFTGLRLARSLAPAL